MITEQKNIRIKTEVLEKVRDVKNILGIPMAYFVEQAVIEKIAKLPKKDKDKLTK